MRSKERAVGAALAPPASDRHDRGGRRKPLPYSTSLNAGAHQDQTVTVVPLNRVRVKEKVSLYVAFCSSRMSSASSSPRRTDSL